MQTATIQPRSDTTAREPKHLGAGDGEHVWFLDNLLTVKLSPREGAPFSLVESRLPADSHTPFHRHDREDEAFYVLEGALRVFLEGGRTVEAGPGAYLHIPRGTAHGFRTLAPTRMLVIAGADGFIEMAREAGVPAPRPELPRAVAPDVARLEAACARHGIQLLGPLPE